MVTNNIIIIIVITIIRVCQYNRNPLRDKMKNSMQKTWEIRHIYYDARIKSFYVPVEYQCRDDNTKRVTADGTKTRVNRIEVICAGDCQTVATILCE
jgi:hypothetical protein